MDTNIVSALVRGPDGPATRRVRQVGELNVCTSIVVASELRYGAAKKAAPRLTAQLNAVLDAIQVVPLEEPADLAYGQTRVALEAAGTPIGGNDLLIAAQALALGCTVVTANEREFARVPSLPVENWLRT